MMFLLIAELTSHLRVRGHAQVGIGHVSPGIAIRPTIAVRGPYPVRSPVVATPADSVTGGAQDRQDEANDDEDRADGYEDGDAGDEPDDEQDDTKDDHVDSMLSWPHAGPV
jgi:hypothetical protein